VLVEKSIKMAAAAIEFSGQLSNRQIQDFVRLEPLEHLQDVVPHRNQVGQIRLHSFELRRQDSADYSQHMTTMFKAELDGILFHEPEAFLGHWA
jgi:hypothetical protein